jgi:hypothetical protein
MDISFNKTNQITKKTILHQIYLLASALLVASGVILGLFSDGKFKADSLRLFTYQSNILVVLAFVAMLFCGNTKFRYYLSFCTMLAITVTGLVYNFVLMPSSPDKYPLVFNKYYNFVTHLLSMVLVLINYFALEAKGNFSFRHLAAGIVFPLLYWIIFISIGGLINFYPYFFMNAAELGFAKLIMWLVALLAIFVLLGFLLIVFDKRRKVLLEKH